MAAVVQEHIDRYEKSEHNMFRSLFMALNLSLGIHGCRVLRRSAYEPLGKDADRIEIGPGFYMPRYNRLSRSIAPLKDVATVAIRFASAEKVMDLMESLVRVPCETFPEDPSARYKNVEVLSNTFGNTIAHHL